MNVPSISPCGCTVDFLRSCFSSKWRFFERAPEVETAGRFFFVGPQNPGLPFPHDFYSATWENGDPDRTINTGPVRDAPRPWYNGSIAGFVPAAPVGLAWQFNGGLEYPDDADTEELRFGLPLKCWTNVNAPFVPIDALADPGSCCVRLAWARVIELADLGDEVTLQAFFAELLGPGATVTFFPELGLFPSMLFVTSATYSLIFVGGTQNAQQFATQAFTGFQGPIDVGEATTIVPWNAVATLMFSRWMGSGGDPDAPVLAAGYSYGAASLAAFVQRIKNAFPARQVNFFTYGMPKPSDAAGVEVIAKAPGVHVLNHGDIIPQLPISLGQCAWYTPIIGPVISQLWGAWAPMSSYLLQAENGDKHFDVLPGFTGDVLNPIIAKVMALEPLDPILPHRLKEYVRRACVGCHCPKYPFTEASWRIIFPLGCAPNVLGLQAPIAAGGELGLAPRFELPAPLALGGVELAAGALALEFRLETPDELALESLDQAELREGLGLTTRLVRDDFLALESFTPAYGALALTGGTRPCPCCLDGAAPLQFTVEIIAPGYLFDGLQAQVDDYPLGGGECYWDDSATYTNFWMEFSSQNYTGSPYLRCLWDYLDVGSGDYWTFQGLEDLTPEVFTCSPWYFEFTKEIYLNGVTPTGDYATVKVYSVP